MVDAHGVNQQLRRLGANTMFWCRPELRELPKVLFEGEQLHHLVAGRYEGGFALFCATDRRVLLIDKKPFYLTIEDVRYDMISDVQFNHRLLDATVRFGTVHSTISFTGYNHHKLREFTSYVQQQVMLYRQQQSVATPAPEQQTQPQPLPAAALSVAQPEPVAAVEQLLTVPQAPVMNPYKMPLTIRRRVSRFY